MPLGASLLGTIATGDVSGTSLLVFGTLITVIAVTGELSRRLLPAFDLNRADATAPAPFAGAAAQRLVGVLQFATAVVAMFVPLAAALYLTVTVVWTLVQRITLRRMIPPMG